MSKYTVSVGSDDPTTTWDYEGYWRTVLGDRDAATVVSEFDLDRLADRKGWEVAS